MTERNKGLCIVNATIIDGTGRPPLREHAIVMENGRISSITAQGALAFDGQYEILDARHKYAIPGLIDANVHLVMDLDPAVLLRYGPGDYDDLVAEAAQVALMAGFTTVFDTWGPLESLRRVRDRINKAEIPGSRIFLAGNIIGNDGPWSADFVSAEGAAINPAVVAQVNAHWEQSVGGNLCWLPAEEVALVVSEYIRTSGIDFVKYASSAHGLKRSIAFSPDAQAAIVDAAHGAGMTAQACALTPEALKLAINAGVDLLQHADSTGPRTLPESTLQVIVERRLPAVAMMLTERRILAMREILARAPQGLGAHETRMVAKDHNDRRLIEAGARLLFAADAGLVGPIAQTSAGWGALMQLPDFPYELGSAHIHWATAAMERGMEPMEVLRSMTVNVAAAYRRDADIGTIEGGKQADLVLLDADPLSDPESYGRLSAVVKSGTVVDTSRLPLRPVLTGNGEIDRMYTTGG